MILLSQQMNLTPIRTCLIRHVKLAKPLRVDATPLITEPPGGLSYQSTKRSTSICNELFFSGRNISCRNHRSLYTIKEKGASSITCEPSPMLSTRIRLYTLVQQRGDEPLIGDSQNKIKVSHVCQGRMLSVKCEGCCAIKTVYDTD